MIGIIIFNILLLVSPSTSCWGKRNSSPTVQIKTCQAVTAPTNGNVAYSSPQRKEGSTLTYSCDTGYYMQGISSRTCQSDSQWSGNDVSCLMITCSNLPAPSNSAVVHEDSDGATTEYGKKATFTCDSGFTMVGTNPLVCQGSSQPGSWSDSEPSCVKQCPSEPNPTNGVVMYSSPNREEGSTLQISCNSGYYIQGPSERTCQADSSWSDSAATCEPIYCTLFSSVQNGDVTYSGMAGSQIPHGETATFSCNNPYTIQGSETLTCQGTTAIGSWSDAAPFCSNGVSCPDPGTLENGQTTGNSEYYDGATLHFTCNANHKLNGANSISCTAGGTWTDPIPTCSEKRYDCVTSSPCNPLVIQGKVLYLHLDDSKYVQCNNGACYANSCPNGLVFNSKDGYCDWPANVN